MLTGLSDKRGDFSLSGFARNRKRASVTLELRPTALEYPAMLTREEIRGLALEAKDKLGLTWPKIGDALGRAPVYAALLVYGYAQATAEEAEGLVRTLGLPAEAVQALMKAPHRTPAQPWPPTDPFIYRLYEVVMLYGPAFKDVAHELFGDGIMSAIDMSVDITKVEDPAGVPRMELTLNGKWLQYKKF
jgi:cyanate lyase